MAWEAIVEHGVVAVALHGAEKLLRLRFIKCRVFQRNVDIRISFSALLRLCYRGRYLLVRNLHRPDHYGPIGGVYKHYREAQQELDDLQFKPQHVGLDDDMTADIRGFLPRKNLPQLVNWFDRGSWHETAAECLRREVVEELSEVQVNRRVPATLSLRLVRRIEEGPEEVPGQPYTQFRMFEVYEPRDSDEFIRRLFESAESNTGLLSVTADEIATGRAQSNQLIGHHTCYLIGRKRLRLEDPPFAHLN